MLLVEYKNKSGKTYNEIAEKFKLSRFAICHIILHPERTSLKRVKQIAKEIGMPEKEAIQEWRVKKTEKAVRKINEFI